MAAEEVVAFADKWEAALVDSPLGNGDPFRHHLQYRANSNQAFELFFNSFFLYLTTRSSLDLMTRSSTVMSVTQSTRAVATISRSMGSIEGTRSRPRRRYASSRRIQAWN